jgi:hypothetical protein
MLRRIGIAATTLALAATPGLALVGPAMAANNNGNNSAVQGNCPLPKFGPGETYHPKIDPKGFTTNVTNPFFPLPPGEITVYSGVKDGKKALDVSVPTSRTRVIDGVKTRIVEDRLYLNGSLEERTVDYYAQDRCGNVWYFGEDTATLDSRGKVTSTEGTFHAGVDGAQPGVFMTAHPRVGQIFRQEWYKGHAEDVFKVLSLDTKVTVPFGSFQHALLTQETTALEPTVLDHKHYVSRLGEVDENAVKGPAENLQLLGVIEGR